MYRGREEGMEGGREREGGTFQMYLAVLISFVYTNEPVSNIFLLTSIAPVKFLCISAEDFSVK